MATKNIMQGIRAIFKSAWKWHSTNLGLMVHALFLSKRLGVASIGRSLEVSTSPKHAIKRVDRFLGNRAFDHWTAMEELTKAVIGPRKYVYIAVDWTKVRQWPVLQAAVVQKGRAIPILWSVMAWGSMHKSQNAFENGFFTWLSDALPKSVRATVLLDRGFKRVELMKHLERCGLGFIIRTGGNVHVHHAEYHGRMDQLIEHRGEIKDLRRAVLRPSRPVETRVIGTWAGKFKEPWVLATNLKQPTHQIIAAYGKRFRIEETFRDAKDTRFGLALSQLKMAKPLRLERMLLIAAIAHFLAMLVGGHARRQNLDRGFRANTVRTKATHSDFTLGIYYAVRLRWSFVSLLRDFLSERVYLFEERLILRSTAGR